MPVKLINPFTKKDLSITPEGLFENSSLVFPCKEGAYRLVVDDNYTENFGYQWNKFSGTQVDKASELTISKTRYWRLAPALEGLHKWYWILQGPPCIRWITAMP
jgi:hypothetical protein